MGCDAVAEGFVMRATPRIWRLTSGRARLAVLGAEPVTESGQAPAA